MIIRQQTLPQQTDFYWRYSSTNKFGDCMMFDGFIHLVLNNDYKITYKFSPPLSFSSIVKGPDNNTGKETRKTQLEYGQ